MDRYDRQVRLWNTNGQNALSNSSVCFINISSAATETMKNIVLPGINSITIIDSQSTIPSNDSLELLKLNNLKSNYFYDINNSHPFKYIAQNIAYNLSNLNPDVKSINVLTDPLQSFISQGDNFWKQFDCVVYSFDAQTDPYIDQLSEILWHLNIPLVKLSSIGFYSYYTVQFNQLNIIETHQNDLVDLRLDSPWDELISYINNIDISHVSNPNEYFKYPYNVILIKLYQDNKQKFGKKLTTKQIRQEIDKLFLTRDESNLLEAYNKAYLLMKNSSELSENIKELFNNIPNELTFDTSLFWILVSSLKKFYDKYNQLPLSGVLPDMESDSEKYKELKEIYRRKFISDKEFIYFESMQLLNSLNRSPSELKDNDHLITLFVKNCKYLKIINGSKHKNLSEKVLKQVPNNNNMVLYLAFQILEKFIKLEQRYPNQNDKSNLRTLAVSYLCGEKTLPSFPDGLDKFLDEISRYSGIEIHNISAVIGGITGQEIIKLLTNQYIPVNNSLGFDGISGKTHSFKL